MDLTLRRHARAATQGDLDAEARLIAERLRLDLLDEAHVQVASWLGYAPAQRVVPVTTPQPKTPREVLDGMQTDTLALIHAARAALQPLAWRWHETSHARVCLAAIDERLAGGDPDGPRRTLRRYAMFPCGWDRWVDDASWAVVHTLCAAGDADADVHDCARAAVDHAVTAFHPTPILESIRRSLIRRALTISGRR